MADERKREELMAEGDLVADEQPTDEVGSEGGSPGENVETVKPKTPLRGSEATQTVENT
jgi:hypothetical protein